MKQTTALYKQLREQTGSYYEVKIIRGPISYGMDKLKSIRISQALFQDSGPQVGGVNSSKCIVELRELSTNWPRMASFYVMVRIVSDSGQADSAWLSFGTFFTDERKADQYGNLRIVAFDAMLMMEQSWTDKITNVPSNWPITSRKAAQLIEEATLIQFEDISSLDNTLAYIGFDTGSTARDVLKSIAVGNGGSWYVTANGKFRLVRLINREFEGVPAIAGVAVAGISVVGDTSSQSSDSDYDMIQLGLSVKSLESNTPTDAVTGVEIEGNNGLVAFAGNREGYVLKAQCGYANTAIASLCLNRVSGYVYRPFEASVARLDPVAEIGDYVVIANTAYPIVTLEWNVSKKIVADISAPWEEEVDHEYKKLSEAAKQYKRIIEAVHEEAQTAIEQSENSIKLYATQTFVGKSAYEADLQRLYDQIDGAIETWQGNAVPTLNNLPASEWDTDEKKAEHIGDLYLVNTDSDVPEAGNYYRFERSGNTYSWNPLSDTVLTQALTQAMAAAETADRAMLLVEDLENDVSKKATVFVTDTNHPNPTPPYYEGDLWFTGDAILTCIYTRESGTYSASDWEKKNTYVDANALDTAVTSKVEAAFNVAATSITATVTENVKNNLSDDFLTTDGGNTTSFGWELTQNEHAWYANGNKVMSVKQNGLVVEGEIRATSGYIGTANNGFTITASSIRKGMESLNDTDHNGVYIGTDGIALGAGNFKVTSSGAATMKNLQVLGGSISIGEYVDDNGNTQPTFFVSSDGTLHAENGVFNGTIYAENIAHAVTEEQLASVIQNALAAAKNYAAVTAKQLAPSTTIPPYFRAGIIVASEYFYSDGYYVDTGNDSTEFDLANHYHNITANESTGVVTIGAPVKNNGTPPSFNIAATSFYQNNVAAARTSGANEAKANYITWLPTSPADYGNGLIATVGEPITSGNKKYVQAQFNLTAGHQNSDSTTSHNYTLSGRTFNIDVTDLVNSGGTISVSKLSFTSVREFDVTTYNSYADSQYSGKSTSSDKVTATASIKINDSETFQSIPVDITALTNQLQLFRYSVRVNTKRGVNGYDNGYLYIRSNYELRLGDETIVDWRDASGGNCVDISAYVGSGIDADDVKANYISHTPTNSSSWNSLIAQPGNVITSGTHKYIQPKFDLTAGHQNSGSSSTSYDYSVSEVPFNVDVTDLINSGSSGGISIDDVTITDARPASYSESATKEVSFVNYSDRVKRSGGVISGRVNVDVGVAGNAITRTLFVKMPLPSSVWSVSKEDLTYDILNDDNAGTIELSGNYISYGNNTLTGYIEIQHKNEFKHYWINMDTSKVPTSGGSVTVEPKDITTNGTYRQPSGVRWDPITVNVKSGGGYTIGSASSTFTANGTYYANNDGLDGWSVIKINVPNGGSYTGGYYTLIGDAELCIVNYSRVNTQLYYYEDGRYQPWTGVNLYYGTETVRYDSGDTLYLYSKN